MIHRVNDDVRLADDPARTASPSAGDPRVAQIMRQYLEALEAGRRPDRERLMAEHPEIAGELAECLDGLEFIREVAPQLSDAGEAAADEKSPTIHPTAALGDFRILRQLGRGGMGVVYEAEQLSLGRRVALKVLPFAAMLDEKQLKRFQNEARAAATLDHPNIVSVYSVGTDRGVHYYAMQLIEGQSMAEVIDELRRANADPEPALAASASERVRREGVDVPDADPIRAATVRERERRTQPKEPKSQ
jgi:hypothetical protein